MSQVAGMSSLCMMYFCEEDAKIIVALTLHAGQENILAWHYDKMGCFTMRSAYKAARDIWYDEVKHTAAGLFFVQLNKGRR